MKNHGVRIVDNRDMGDYCSYLEARIESIKAENLKLLNEREDQENYIRALEQKLNITHEPVFDFPDYWKGEGEA